MSVYEGHRKEGEGAHEPFLLRRKGLTQRPPARKKTAILFRHFSPASLLAVLILACLVTLFLPSRAAAKSRKWKEWKNCSYSYNPTANDGDSFYIKYGRRRYKIRLYSVDAPETTDNEEWAKERIEAQAKYFGCDELRALRLGRDATRFTARALKNGFTVYTRKQEALGRGKTRYYALVKVGDTYLSEMLVSNGLVRITYNDRMANPMPDGTRKEAFQDRLHKLERQAKRQHIGGWEKTRAVNAFSNREEAPEIENKRITIDHPIPVFSIKKPGTQAGLLRAGSELHILQTESNGMLRVRFKAGEGKVYEAYCRQLDLGM